jgi:cob(I)alamin adenosyltransferase
MRQTMKIYTKRGDRGDTDPGLPRRRPGKPGDGRRVRKSDVRVAALGEVDELNAHIGLCLAACSAAGNGEVAEALRPVQGELCAIAAKLGASPAGGDLKPDEAAPARMERQIDAAWAELPNLAHFILPEGCELACRLHVARTVCRRAERAIVALADSGASDNDTRKVPPEVFRYVNRLSDLLFALARLANRHAGVGEQTWPHPK